MQEIKNLAQNDYLFNIYNIFVTLLLVQSKIGIFSPNLWQKWYSKFLISEDYITKKY